MQSYYTIRWCIAMCWHATSTVCVCAGKLPIPYVTIAPTVKWTHKHLSSFIPSAY